MYYLFPGMNLYLENPELWSEVHSRLIVNLADSLGTQLRPLAKLLGFILRESIPIFSLPLKLNEQEPLVNLPQLLNYLYEKGSFDLIINLQSTTYSSTQ